MQQRNATKLQKLYGVELSDVADFVLYTALSNVRADELAVIKVKDVQASEGVAERMRQRIAEQRIKFKDYRPEEYYLIEKRVLKSKGLFVFFAVSRDADPMERQFDQAVR